MASQQEMPALLFNPVHPIYAPEPRWDLPPPVLPYELCFLTSPFTLFAATLKLPRNFPWPAAFLWLLNTPTQFPLDPFLTILLPPRTPQSLPLLLPRFRSASQPKEGEGSFLLAVYPTLVCTQILSLSLQKPCLHASTIYFTSSLLV